MNPVDIFILFYVIFLMLLLKRPLIEIDNYILRKVWPFVAAVAPAMAVTFGWMVYFSI